MIAITVLFLSSWQTIADGTLYIDCLSRKSKAACWVLIMLCPTMLRESQQFKGHSRKEVAAPKLWTSALEIGRSAESPELFQIGMMREWKHRFRGTQSLGRETFKAGTCRDSDSIEYSLLRFPNCIVLLEILVVEQLNSAIFWIGRFTGRDIHPTPNSLMKEILF